MKNVLMIVLALLLSANVWAATGTDLIKARDAAIVEATVELDIDTVTAFEVTPVGDEVEVAFKDANDTHHFHCHYHGSDMACHEEGGHHKATKAEDVGFDHMEEGHEEAMVKLEKTLKRRGKDLSILKSIKVWKLSEEDSGDDGHEHGADVWTKVSYELNNKEVTVFVQCHEHEHKSSGMECHYKSKGKDEPTL